MFHIEFDNTALDVLDVGHVYCSKQFIKNAVAGIIGGRVGRRRRSAYCCYKLNLQLGGFSVHSLIEAEVAANKDWR